MPVEENPPWIEEKKIPETVQEKSQ
ncbi:hypothetical protein [Okeania sp. SIO3I5]